MPFYNTGTEFHMNAVLSQVSKLRFFYKIAPYAVTLWPNLDITGIYSKDNGDFGTGGSLYKNCTFTGIFHYTELYMELMMVVLLRGKIVVFTFTGVKK